MHGRNGKLYVVSTPIGNLGDFSFRAVEILRTVGVIAAEDTRHSRRLLAFYGINTPMIALHEHNESTVAANLADRIAAGVSVALVSDAGTPLVNDPGFVLVRAAKERHIDVVPVPGACALIAALSVSGLPTDRFSFEGFPPRSQAARRAWLMSLKETPKTLVFYESRHRILGCVEAISKVFPPERQIVVARELTKIHETVMNTTVARVLPAMTADPNMQKGEFVILIQGAPASDRTSGVTAEQARILRVLLRTCSVRTAASVAAEITGARRRVLYEHALKLTGLSDKAAD